MSIFKSTPIFWFLGLPAVIGLIFLTITGTRLLINPVKLNITPCGEVVMFREYPLYDFFQLFGDFNIGYPLVRYVMTVTPINSETNNGYVCREDNGRGQRYNHDHDRGYGRWSINHFAQQCLEDPEGFMLDIQYTALLGDLIPLRPIRIGTVVTKRDNGFECSLKGPVGPIGPPGERGPRGLPGLN